MFTELARTRCCRTPMTQATVVDVTVGSDGSVTSVNNGRPFTATDAEALCRSASSSKTRGDSIGYRGISFKSLAVVASKIEVRSAQVSFSFDRDDSVDLLAAAGKPKPADIPLIRNPTRISRSQVVEGATFVITPKSASIQVIGAINPLALLFLNRALERLRVHRASCDCGLCEAAAKVAADRVYRVAASWQAQIAVTRRRATR